MDPPLAATELLRKAKGGHREAIHQLLPIVYDELVARAGAYLRRERAGHTLQPTALVHEVYLRLIDAKTVQWQERSHFLAIAARNMRQVLISHAKSKNAGKRPPPALRVPLKEGLRVDASFIDVLEFDELLGQLSDLNERMARIVEMRFFAGMKMEEIAEEIGVDARTVKRDWKAARMFLLDRLRDVDGSRER